MVTTLTQADADPGTMAVLDTVIFNCDVNSPATYLSTSADSASAGMQNSSAQPGSITISNSGELAGTFTLTNMGANALAFGTPSGSLLGFGGSMSSSLGWASTTTTGSQRGFITLTGLSPGDVGTPQTAAVSGAVVANRTVTASPVNLGMFHAGTTTTASGAGTLSTTGDDNNFTRVTIATSGGSGSFLVDGGTGTLFNSAASVGSRTLSGTFERSRQLQWQRDLNYHG